MKVWIATVDTRSEIVAVAETEQDAICIAAEKALEWLTARGAIYEGENDTVENIIGYFGVVAYPIEVGTAVVEGRSGNS